MFLRVWKASGKAGARSNREIRWESARVPAPGDTSGVVESCPSLPTPPPGAAEGGVGEPAEGEDRGTR